MYNCVQFCGVVNFSPVHSNCFSKKKRHRTKKHLKRKLISFFIFHVNHDPIRLHILFEHHRIAFVLTISSLLLLLLLDIGYSLIGASCTVNSVQRRISAARNEKKWHKCLSESNTTVGLSASQIKSLVLVKYSEWIINEWKKQHHTFFKPIQYDFIFKFNEKYSFNFFHFHFYYGRPRGEDWDLNLMIFKRTWWLFTTMISVR